MREFLSFFIAALCLSAVLFSCKKEEKATTPNKVSHKIELSVSQDLLNVADLTLTYTDENNNVVKTIKIESPSFTNTVTYTAFPVTTGFHLTLTQKEGVSGTEKLNLSITGITSVSVLKDNAEELISGSVDNLNVSFIGVQPSILSNTLQKVQNLLNSFSTTYNISVKDGSVVCAKS